MYLQTNTYKRLLSRKKTNSPTKIIVHHSGGSDKNPTADTGHHTAKDIESWHLAKKWIGIGYHYVIHKDGEVWLGRPEHVHGAHTKGQNKNSIGICLSGNFDVTKPSTEQAKSLTTLLNTLAGSYNIKSDNILPHRKFANKTCYGNNLADTWAADLLGEQSPLSKYSSLELVKELILRMKK